MSVTFHVCREVITRIDAAIYKLVAVKNPAEKYYDFKLFTSFAGDESIDGSVKATSYNQAWEKLEATMKTLNVDITLHYVEISWPDKLEEGINMANGNARRFLEILGIEPNPELHGGISVAEAKNRLLCAKAHPQVFNAVARPTIRHGNTIECGYSADDILRRIEAIENLISLAEKVTTSSDRLHLTWC